MKKIFSAFLACILAFSFASCSKAKTLSLENFVDIVKAHDFEFVDISGQYSEDTTQSATMAYNDTYQITFVICNSNEDAYALFEAEKATFLGYAEGAELKNVVESNSGSYHRYSMTAMEKYCFTACVGNTYITLRIDDWNEGDVLPILEELGFIQ